MFQSLIAGGVTLLFGSVLLRRLLKPGPVTLLDPLDEPPPAPVTPATADRSVTIVDNGGRPFIVHISYKRRVASVYANTTDDDEDGDGGAAAKKAPEELRSFHFKRAFVGLDPKEPEAKLAAAGKLPKTAEAAPVRGAVVQRRCTAAEAASGQRHIWWYGGHSMLLDLGRQHYVFIGWMVFAFTVPDHINAYVSIMGNSAVPYPYALGTENTYFLIEETYIPNHVIERFRVNGQVPDDDPYGVLYGDDLDRWLPGVDPREPLTRPPDGGSRWRRQFPLQDYKLLVARRW